METKNSMSGIIEKWKNKSKIYFELAKNEKDQVGAKFYMTSAIAHFNCIQDIKKLKPVGLTK